MAIYNRKSGVIDLRIIEPSATSYGQADAQRTDGNQTLRLTGRARMMQGQASGLYQGSYTMVFAYN
ncbi:MAG: hypothetical protein Q7J06_07775 [Bacteroidales bacterium]|nr:hypothetical protein [Bacteroidales bacterium]